MARQHKYYPVFLDLGGRAAVVVGGGITAERKAMGLLRAGAKVTIVSPEVTPGLESVCSRGEARCLKREYRAGDLEGAWIAVAATNDEGVNLTVAREAQAREILVNVVDRPGLCTFIAPSILERGDLTVAVSTGGRSPALARRVREELEALIPAEYGALLEVVAGVRERLKSAGERAPAELWSQALALPVLDLVKQGRIEDAQAALVEALRVRTPAV